MCGGEPIHKIAKAQNQSKYTFFTKCHQPCSSHNRKSLTQNKKQQKQTYQTTLVAQSAVRSNEDVIGNSLSEDLDLQDVGNNLLSLAIDIGVNQCDVIVAGNNVAQSRKSLLNTLDGNRVR